jgi:hypothetical protein
MAGPQINGSGRVNVRPRRAFQKDTEKFHIQHRNEL